MFQLRTTVERKQILAKMVASFIECHAITKHQVVLAIYRAVPGRRTGIGTNPENHT